MQIYLTKNLVNGKMYIGQDTKDNLEYLGSGVAIRHAIKKYGKQNFSKTILVDKIDNIVLLNYWESFYISLFNAQENEAFYNIAAGGFNTISRPIYQFDKEGILIKKFDSLESAAFTLNIKNKGNLSLAAQGKRNYVRHFRWSFSDVPNTLSDIKVGRKTGTKNTWKIVRKHANVSKKIIEILDGETSLGEFIGYEALAQFFGTTSEIINQAIIRSKKGYPYKKKYNFKIKGTIKQTQYNDI